MQLNSENILGYSIGTITRDQFVQEISRNITLQHPSVYLICANPHSLEVALKDPAFDLAIQNADLIVPDGVGIVIASKILGGTIRERITGMDIFLALSERLNKEGKYRYFFLGSTEQNLVKIQEKLSADYPNITVAGIYSPPFKPEFSGQDNELMIAAINRADPDVLWIGMTAPKQEKWIYQNKDRLNVKFIGAIGAVFDFYTDNVKRSHPVFQKLGLEWLPRLLRQPRRLWRRNFVSNPMFILRVFKQRLSGSARNI